MKPGPRLIGIIKIACAALGSALSALLSAAAVACLGAHCRGGAGAGRRMGPYIEAKKKPVGENNGIDMVTSKCRGGVKHSAGVG